MKITTRRAMNIWTHLQVQEGLFCLSPCVTLVTVGLGEASMSTWQGGLAWPSHFGVSPTFNPVTRPSNTGWVDMGTKCWVPAWQQMKGPGASIFFPVLHPLTITNQVVVKLGYHNQILCGKWKATSVMKNRFLHQLQLACIGSVCS